MSTVQPKKVIVPFRNPEKLKPYLEALRQVGVEPHPHLAESPAHIDSMAGLLLVGGDDINPFRYGETAAPETDAPDDERDAVEFDILNQALEKDLPVLAICRGFQLLNIYHGGSLQQHLASTLHDPALKDRAAAAHEVTVEPGTLLHTAAGSTRLRVNSRHHQGVSKVGSALRVSGKASEDHLIEGLERPDKRFVLAVQWHPEDQIQAHPEQLSLFQSFAAAVELGITPQKR